MKILVTGGAGFIGSGYIRYMLNKYPECEIVCLDALTYAGKRENLPNGYGERLKFVKGNICFKSTVNRVVEEHRPDAIVNFAAHTHVDRSIRRADPFIRSNVLGTQVLLDAALKHGGIRFHQISTDEVYGSLPLKDSSAFTESSPLSPSSPYSSSKASADLIALSYFRTYGLPVTVSRCSNNYGERQHAEKLIPTVIRKALKNAPIPLYGTGENVRDWLHVDDHVRAIDMILGGGRIGEIYNIGGDCELSNTEIANMLLAIMDKPTSLIRHVADRPGHDLRYAIDHSKITRELGWRPTVNITEGLFETVKSMRTL